MKLRNKKTGEIWDIPHYKEITMDDGKVKYTYKSLAEVNENWEDYAPKESLIKDEKKRKSLQRFSNLTKCKTFEFQAFNNCFVHEFDNGVAYSIDFDNSDGLEELEKYETYAIEELCGEEE